MGKVMVAVGGIAGYQKVRYYESRANLKGEG